MYDDGYVIDVKVTKCENNLDQTLDTYIAILSKVKPRTRILSRRKIFTSHG